MVPPPGTRFRDFERRVFGVSVVIPCLNEADSVGHCVRSAVSATRDLGVSVEVLVVDNGSTDGSQEIARSAGARVISEPRRGYGSAYQAGFKAARGEFVVMGDSDGTYDFGEIPRILRELNDGADLVIGDRMAKIHDGAMPALHRLVGNPLLTGLINGLFRTGAVDPQCGLRGFRRTVLPLLDLRTTGWEYAAEMVIRASKAGLTIRTIPIEYHAREGESKLSSFAAGWRNLRFLLAEASLSLIIAPALVGLAIGVGLMLWPAIGGLAGDAAVWPLLCGTAVVFASLQGVFFVASARAYGSQSSPARDQRFEQLRGRLRMWHGVAAATLLLAVSAALGVLLATGAIEVSDPSLDLALAVIAGACALGAVQILVGSALLSMLNDLREREDRPSATEMLRTEQAVPGDSPGREPVKQSVGGPQ